MDNAKMIETVGNLEKRIDFLKDELKRQRSASNDVSKKAREVIGSATRDFLKARKSGQIAGDTLKAIDYATETGVDVFAQIYDILPEFSVAFKTLRNIPVYKTTAFLTAQADPVAGFFRFSTSGNMVVDSTINHTRVQATPSPIGGVVEIPMEVLEDTDANLGAEVVIQLNRAIGRAADYAAFLAGGGTTVGGSGYTDGGFTGITKNTNYDFTTTVANLGALTADAIEGLKSKVSPTVLTSSKAAFWMPVETYIALRGKALATAATALEGGTSANFPGVIKDGVGEFLGYPVYLTNVLSKATFASGDPLVVFGDGLGYNVGIAKQLELLQSPVYGDAFMDYSVVFRGVTRAGFVGNPSKAFAGIKIA